jgi:hypothetical protein
MTRREMGVLSDDVNKNLLDIFGTKETRRG